jgi:hypothetical protein
LQFRGKGPEVRRIELGPDDAVLAGVEAWLRRVRRAYRIRRLEEGQQRDFVQACKEQSKKYGESRRQKRDIGQRFDEIAGNPLAVFKMYYLVRFQGPLPRRQPGRPRKTPRLW